LTGVTKAVESQAFTYNVKLTNETGYPLLTWIEVIDNSTKCKICLSGILSDAVCVRFSHSWSVWKRPKSHQETFLLRECHI